MEFGEKIREIRTNRQLTQEQFAIQLNVTRQAVSNWENNRNLPDLELLILMANTFHLSLDELILGGTAVNNMTEKLIQDGSEVRKAKLNFYSTIVGSMLLILGMMCLFIKANSVEYIDSSGMLHENFYLLPIGFVFLLSGGIAFLTIGVRYIKDKFSHQ